MWELIVPSQGEEGLLPRPGVHFAASASEMFKAVPCSLFDKAVYKVLLLKIILKEPFCVGTIALVLCGLGLRQSSGGSDRHYQD